MRAALHAMCGLPGFGDGGELCSKDFLLGLSRLLLWLDGIILQYLGPAYTLESVDADKKRQHGRVQKSG